MFDILWKKIVGLTTISLAVSACGGAGSGTSSSSAPPPVVNQAVGGIWNSQTIAANGDSVKAMGLVAEDGRGVFFSQNLTNGCAAVGIGSLAANGNTISGSAQVGVVNFSLSPSINTSCAFADGSTSATESITGTVAQRVTLTLTGKVTTANGTVEPAEPAITAAFDSLYSAGSSLSTISGNWTGPTGVVMSINSSGVIFAQDPASGCVINGQVSIIDAAYNAYSASATYANCRGSASILNGVTATGLMAVDTTVSPAILYAGYSATVGSTTIIVAATAIN